MRNLKPKYTQLCPSKVHIYNNFLKTRRTDCLTVDEFVSSHLSLQNWNARMKTHSQNSTIITNHTTDELHPNFIPLSAILVPSILLAVVILFGNSLVVLSYKINNRLRTRTNEYLVSLAISDLLVGGISLPMWIYIILIEFKESYTFKAAFRIFDVFAALASIYHLSAISIERYIAVSRPFYYKCLPVSFHRAMISSTWILAGFLASLSSVTTTTPWISRVYSTVLFIGGFTLPIAITACMYTGVFSVARSLLRRNSSRTASQDSTKSLKKYYQRERKVAITVALITGLFLVAWVPFFTVSITAAYCPHCLPSSPGSLRGLVIIVKSVHYLNSAVNPLVYARRNPEMKRTFLKLLGLKRFNSEKETPWGFPLKPRY